MRQLQLRSPTGKSIAVRAVWPNMGVQAWYERQLDSLVAESATELERSITAAWNTAPPLIGHVTVADSAIRAAGVWFTASKGREPLHLLLHRTDGQGWAFPGGHIEEGETDEDAARREVFEEIGFDWDWIDGSGLITRYGAVHFTTFRAFVGETFTPQLCTEHSEYRWCTADEACALPIHPGVRELIQGPELVGDAKTPTKHMQVALRRWGSDYMRRFDDMSKKIANDFAVRNAQATEISMRAQFKRAGFTVAFKPTAASVEAFRGVVKINVALIKSIPRQYHDKVVKRVYEAVNGGSDLHTLTKELREVHAITRKRAALIARDQNAKAKATIEQARRLELGISRARWRHSHAGQEKYKRPSHVKASADGVTFSTRKGWYDPDEKQYILPGELIECKCSSDAIIPGFES